MRNCIDTFIALCKEQPFDVQKIRGIEKSVFLCYNVSEGST